MARKKFTLPKRCPYCAHKLRADDTCRNTECVIGYVPDKTKDTDKKTKESNTESK